VVAVGGPPESPEATREAVTTLAAFRVVILVASVSVEYNNNLQNRVIGIKQLSRCMIEHIVQL
jgi:hypothetical protein